MTKVWQAGIPTFRNHMILMQCNLAALHARYKGTTMANQSFYGGASRATRNFGESEAKKILIADPPPTDWQKAKHPSSPLAQKRQTAANKLA